MTITGNVYTSSDKQRRVEPLERGEVAARLGAVADRAERERDPDVAAREAAQEPCAPPDQATNSQNSAAASTKRVASRVPTVAPSS